MCNEEDAFSSSAMQRGEWATAEVKKNRKKKS